MLRHIKMMSLLVRMVAMDSAQRLQYVSLDSTLDQVNTKETGQGQGSLNILLENASKMIELLKFKQNY